MTFVDLPDADATCGFFVPGRVEVLGKHTDYAGGRSLLAAIERGIRVAGSPRHDGMVHVVDARSGEEITFPLSDRLVSLAGQWWNYPVTVARRIARNFPGATRGADITISSDLPQAAGMSSSSALMVAIFLVLAEVNALRESDAYRATIRSDEELAAYLGCVENGQSFGTLTGDAGVGTFGGSEDHVAMLCSAPGILRQYAFDPVRLERSISFPADHVFVIATSGVVAEKTGAARDAYNRASLAARAVVERWNAATGERARTIGQILARGPDSAARLRAVVDDASLRARLDAFAAESTQIIPAAGDALARGELETFGVLVARSQRVAEELLGNQVAETAHLARSARPLGAVAASAFGAGFGGSVWAMVHVDHAERFATAWRADYVAAFPARTASAEVFVTRPGPGVRRLR